MLLSKFIFLFPAAAAVILLSKYIWENKKSRRLKKRGRFYSFSNLSKFLSPRPQSKLYKMYEDLLRFTKWKVEDLNKFKLIVFICVLSGLFLVKLTNIFLYTDEILKRFDYHADLIYRAKACMNEEEALKQEIGYFRKAAGIIGTDTLKNEVKENIEDLVKAIITEPDTELMQPRATIANKIYYRLYDYYKCREWNILLYIMIAFMFTFIAELALSVYNFFIRTEAKRELRFLKKLIILNGSIKPVDFNKLLRLLIGKSNYHKKSLLKIEEMNKRNSVNNREIYYALIRSTNDIELKLFYEKLDQANNYDFDQAIVNIENEFQIDRRSQAREVKKQTEIIHAVGIVGFMALVFILIIYLITPWLQAYNMNEIF